MYMFQLRIAVEMIMTDDRGQLGDRPPFATLLHVYHIGLPS